MDNIDVFLEKLHINTAPEFQGISEKALEMYRNRGQLTPKLYEWAIRTAKFQKVKLPSDFSDVAPDDVQPVGQQPVGHVIALPLSQRADATDKILADALMQAAHALVTAAERLRSR